MLAFFSSFITHIREEKQSGHQSHRKKRMLMAFRIKNIIKIDAIMQVTEPKIKNN
jgi:hypothetical protein